MVAKTSFFRVPQLTERLLPFSVLVGAMACYLALSRRNELVVARSAGMSAWQFVAPAVIVAFVLGIVATAVYNPLSAMMREWSKQLEAEMFGDKKNAMQQQSGARLLGASAQPRRAVDRVRRLKSGTGRKARRRQRIHLRSGRQGARAHRGQARNARAWPLEARSGPDLPQRRAAARSGDLSGQDQPDGGAGAGKLFHPGNRAVLATACVYRDRRAVWLGRRRL